MRTTTLSILASAVTMAAPLQAQIPTPNLPETNISPFTFVVPVRVNGISPPVRRLAVQCGLRDGSKNNVALGSVVLPVPPSGSVAQDVTVHVFMMPRGTSDSALHDPRVAVDWQCSLVASNQPSGGMCDSPGADPRGACRGNIVAIDPYNDSWVRVRAALPTGMYLSHSLNLDGVTGQFR